MEAGGGGGREGLARRDGNGKGTGEEADLGLVEGLEGEDALHEERLGVLHVEVHEAHLSIASPKGQSAGGSGRREGGGKGTQGREREGRGDGKEARGLTMAIPIRTPRTALEVSPRS